MTHSARPERLILAAGVCAALHVAKLPPAIPGLQQSLGLSLVQSGFLLSMVQLAGLLLAVAVGAWSHGWGARRSMLAGLLLAGAASGLGSATSQVAVLMALRALEGFGFLLVVLPGPAWLGSVLPAARLPAALGGWSTYMPLATTLALLAGPLFCASFGWRAWWALIGALSWAMALLLWARTRPEAPQPQGADSALARRLRETLRHPGPWLLAILFGLYAFQWLAVVGFLPTLFSAAGVSAAATGPLTALVAAVNVLGNLFAGRMLQHGAPAWRPLALGLVVMALGSAALFGEQLPAPMRYAGALAFSIFGGLIPATLFALSLRLAPPQGGVATTTGWVQQGSALGQFLGPPAVAAVAAATGGWQFSALVTGAAALAALAVLPWLQRATRRA